MSVHIVLLLLELKWIYNLDNHDPFSSFGVIKVPDNDSYFYHENYPSHMNSGINSNLLTLSLMHNAFFLLQSFNTIEVLVLHYQNNPALL